MLYDFTGENWKLELHLCPWLLSLAYCSVIAEAISDWLYCFEATVPLLSKHSTPYVGMILYRMDRVSMDSLFAECGST